MSEQANKRRRRGRGGVSAAVSAVLENDKLVADWEDEATVVGHEEDTEYHADEHEDEATAGPAKPKVVRGGKGKGKTGKGKGKGTTRPSRGLGGPAEKTVRHTAGHY